MATKKRTVRRKRAVSRKMPPRDPKTGAFLPRTARKARTRVAPKKRRTAPRRSTARRNPVVSRADTEYYIVFRHPEKGPFYFDGEYMTNTIRRAAFYKNKEKAHHIAQKIAEQLGQPIAVQST